MMREHTTQLFMYRAGLEIIEPLLNDIVAIPVSPINIFRDKHESKFKLIKNTVTNEAESLLATP